MSSYYTTLEREYTSEFEYIPDIVNYPSDGCPDRLSYSRDVGFCILGCVYPLLQEWEETAIDIIGYICGTAAFFVCYFYCLTGVIRPIMLKFPNTNIYHMMLSLMIMSIPSFFPIFLGEEYVYCDTYTDYGNDNWACKLSGMF